MIQIYLLLLVILLVCLYLDRSHRFYLYPMIGLGNMFILELLHVEIIIQLAVGLIITIFSTVLLSLPIKVKKEYYLNKLSKVTQEIYITTPGEVTIEGKIFKAYDANGLGIEKGQKARIVEINDDYVKVAKNG